MFQKIILTIIFNLSIIYCQNFKLHPMVKSALIPGWGQNVQNRAIRARAFRVSEILLWSTFFGTYTFSNNERLNYMSFASEHAGIDPSGKSHQYWVDIGNYKNIISYNEEHLRFREPENLYMTGTGFDWNWDTENNRKKFEDMRIHSDILTLTGNFLIGAVVLNHIISAIDALYLVRLERISSIGLIPTLDYNGSLSLNINMTFDLQK